MRKRSVTIDGHRTSISLEDAFWAELSEIARARSLSLNALVAEIDHARGTPQGSNTGNNLSGALRLYVLDDLRKRTISRA
ncbi:ribbon-helix-helix domain-containing protein [Reyranella sp.]|uniref:ribbon-helix-helix domain-containing protein n=1 Tax=Reyranella sp. TaxID=1929291 RepID=UPI0027303F65|nr:ribbon-helix-helix domain-containing protein [Reyranella sp.]MDP2373618.1 ribbon-helix-helix domain-containing protein [Reyranella sp.]